MPNYTIEAVDRVKNEGDTGRTEFRFKITRDAEVPEGEREAVTFSADAGTTDVFDFVRVKEGPATPGYQPWRGLVEFAAGEKEKIITVTIEGDREFEPNEILTVALDNRLTFGADRETDLPSNIDHAINAAASAQALDGHASAVVLNDDGLASHNAVLKNPGYLERAGLTTRDGNAHVREKPTEESVQEEARRNAEEFAGEMGEDGEVSEDELDTLDRATEGLDDAFVDGLKERAREEAAKKRGEVQTEEASYAIEAIDRIKNEGDEGTTTFRFKIARDGAVPNGGYERIELELGGTTEAADQAQIENVRGNSLIFSPGEHEKIVTVSVAGDTTFEPNEILTLTMSEVKRGSFSGGETPLDLPSQSASAIVKDDDGEKPGVTDEARAAVAEEAREEASDTALGFDDDGEVTEEELEQLDRAFGGEGIDDYLEWLKEYLDEQNSTDPAEESSTDGETAFGTSFLKSGSLLGANALKLGSIANGDGSAETPASPVEKVNPAIDIGDAGTKSEASDGLLGFSFLPDAPLFGPNGSSNELPAHDHGPFIPLDLESEIERGELSSGKSAPAITLGTSADTVEEGFFGAASLLAQDDGLLLF